MRAPVLIALSVTLLFANVATAKPKLHELVKAGEPWAVAAVMPHKKIDKADKKGNAPIHYAAAAANVEILGILLTHGADPNVINKRYDTTPLHELARSTERSPSAKRKTMAMLLNHGANLDVTDSHGETPLAAASRNGNAVVVDAILSHGDVDADALEGALLLAREHSRYGVIRLLETRGVQSDAGRDEALLLAAERGDFAVVDNLVGGGANVNRADEQGQTPLINAVGNGHTAVAEFLLDNGANVNAANNEGVTALHIAAGRGDLALIDELLSRNAKINAQSESEGTPLNSAAKKEHVPVVKHLLANGAEPVRVDGSAEHLFGSGLGYLMHADFHADQTPENVTAERRETAAELFDAANAGFAESLKETEKARKRKRRAEAITDALAATIATAAMVGLEHMRQEQIRANQRQTAQIMALSGAQSHQDYFRRVRIYEDAMINPQYNRPFQVDFNDTALVNRNSITGLDVAISEYERRIALTDKLRESTGVPGQATDEDEE